MRESRSGGIVGRQIAAGRAGRPNGSELSSNSALTGFFAAGAVAAADGVGIEIKEEWKRIKGYKKYEVSRSGGIRAKHSKRPLKFVWSILTSLVL